MSQLSLIIPAYNEARRLPGTIQRIFDFTAQHPGAPSLDIWVVDDGSTDDTAEWVQKLALDRPNLHLIKFPRNRGKGAAVKAGMLEATGDALLLYDADGATPIEEVLRLWPSFMDENVPVVIGSRAKPSESTHIKTVWYRRIIGRVFNTVVGLLIQNVDDTQCGFKLFQREVARQVFGAQTLDGFAFDVEILHIVQKNDIPMAEIPINWENVEGSKVNLVMDSAKMFRDVLGIWLRSLRGSYRLLEKVEPSGQAVLSGGG